MPGGKSGSTLLLKYPWDSSTGTADDGGACLRSLRGLPLILGSTPGCFPSWVDEDSKSSSSRGRRVRGCPIS